MTCSPMSDLGFIHVHHRIIMTQVESLRPRSGPRSMRIDKRERVACRSVAGPRLGAVLPTASRVKFQEGRTLPIPEPSQAVSLAWEL